MMLENDLHFNTRATYTTASTITIALVMQALYFDISYNYMLKALTV